MRNSRLPFGREPACFSSSAMRASNSSLVGSDIYSLQRSSEGMIPVHAYRGDRLRGSVGHLETLQRINLGESLLRSAPQERKFPPRRSQSPESASVRLKRLVQMKNSESRSGLPDSAKPCG